MILLFFFFQYLSFFVDEGERQGSEMCTHLLDIWKNNKILLITVMYSVTHSVSLSHHSACMYNSNVCSFRVEVQFTKKLVNSPVG